MVKLLDSLKNEIEVKWWNFPAGEVGCRITEDTNDLNLTVCVLNDYSSEAIMKALMLSQAVQDTYGVKPALSIPYLPYGRQDKVHCKGEGASRDMMLKILEPNFDGVTVVDAHSKIKSEHTKSMELTECFVQYWTEKSYTHIVFPDAGAKAKYKFPNYTTVAAVKTRDKATGKIIAYELEEEIPKDASVLVVDDICDGGRTFLELAKLLPINRDLFVTHGIFSRGIELIEAQYDNVFYVHGVKAYV